MEDAEKLALAVFGGIITLAIISVFISPNSRAPEAIQAISAGLANVVSAAANPVSHPANAGNGASTFSTSGLPNIGGLEDGAGQVFGALGVSNLSQLGL